MFILVQAHQYTRYKSLMDQAFRLRKRVFHDQLGWAVTIDDDCEHDEYDALRPAYLMWCNDRADRLYGTVNGGVKSCHAAAQKSATCGARMRPPGGLRPERGSHVRVAIFEGRQPAFRARLWARR